MEFNEKLHTLRKHKGLTQDELAAALFVSRAAISKWESGRGYPGIDSLKAIAKFFNVTIDELLSGDELITVAQADRMHREAMTRSLVFALLDISVLMLFFLPLFANKSDTVITAANLLALTEISLWLKILYFAVVIVTFTFGVLSLLLRNCSIELWKKVDNTVSLALSLFVVMLFTLSLQPYAAVLTLVFLIIKALMLIKSR